MNIYKVVRDSIRVSLLGKDYKPLYELSEYFRLHGAISFDNHKGKDGEIVAVSSNFAYGSIITSGKDKYELDKNIRDAILTTFEVPSIYAKDAKIQRVNEAKEEYALA
jgi:hypothetical protein